MLEVTVRLVSPIAAGGILGAARSIDGKYTHPGG